MMNMTVAELKKLLSDLPDNMPVVIPVIDEDDCNHIFGFRFVRTAGILSCDGEEYRTVLCLNAANGQDIADQVYFREEMLTQKRFFLVSLNMTRERRTK